VDHATDTTTILLIRHTDVYNPDDILYGRLPRFHLSELGLEQAENTARALAEEPISTIYCSPRLRARQTAKIIASAHPGVRVRTTRLLDEVLTAWQGRPHSALEHITFNFYDNPMHPDDESLGTVWGRVERFISLARKRHPGQTVAAVSHGDPVMLARAAYIGLPLNVPSLRAPNVYPGKGSITRLVFPLDLAEKQPVDMAYFDPNSHGEPWSTGWVALNRGQAFVHAAKK
jgi:broad specificity phosphatase PhoE